MSILITACFPNSNRQDFPHLDRQILSRQRGPPLAIYPTKTLQNRPPRWSNDAGVSQPKMSGHVWNKNSCMFSMVQWPVLSLTKQRWLEETLVVIVRDYGKVGRLAVGTYKITTLLFIFIFFKIFSAFGKQCLEAAFSKFFQIITRLRFGKCSQMTRNSLTHSEGLWLMVDAAKWIWPFPLCITQISPHWCWKKQLVTSLSPMGNRLS
jgi:hypothetical protein